TAEYFPSFSEHLITNFQYGASLGTATSWDFYTGTYNPAAVSVGDPQGVSWARAGIGLDQENLANGELIGFVNVTRHAPDPPLPETSVPLPSSEAATALGM